MIEIMLMANGKTSPPPILFYRRWDIDKPFNPILYGVCENHTPYQIVIFRSKMMYFYIKMHLNSISCNFYYHHIFPS